MKKKVLLVICALVLAIITGAWAYYGIVLKPRIRIVCALIDFFDAEESDTNIFETSGGYEIRTTKDNERAYISIYQNDEKVLDIFIAQEGFSIVAKDITEKTYFVPWDDNIRKDLDSAPVFEFLAVSDTVKDYIAQTLISARDIYFTQEEPVNTRYFLNEILGYGDVSLDFYKAFKSVTLKSLGKENKDINGEYVECDVFEVHVPQEIVREIFTIQDIPKTIRRLGMRFLDADIKIYMHDDELMLFEGISEYENFPKIEGEISLDSLKGDLKDITYENLPFKVNFWKNAEKILVNVAFNTNGINVDETVSCYGGADEIPEYDNKDDINILEMKKLRMLLEALKWKEFFDGKGTD